MKTFALILLISCMVITGCTNQNEFSNEIITSLEEKEEKRIINLVVESENISKNKIDENIEQSIFIYLPPSYYSSEKNYPVVYFLPGLGCANSRISVQCADELDTLMREQRCEEMIIVEINGLSKLGGSYYVNSPVSGYWEDYILYEVVPIIDKNLRTISESSARGISGFSMGGFGAINLGMRHPDVFSRVLGVAPTILNENKMNEYLESLVLSMRCKRSYGAAFSPNLELEYPYANILTLEMLESENQILEDWENGIGCWGNKIDTYLELNDSLEGIYIVYSSNDPNKWIVSGCEYVSSLLAEKEVEHTIKVYDIGHATPEEFIADDFAPFFSELSSD